MKKIFSKEQEQKIIKEYLENKNNSLAKLAKKYGVNEVTIQRTLALYNSVPRRLIRYDINHNAFDNVKTEEQFYWLGFLMSDGNVGLTEDNTYRMSLGLKLSDKNHIEKFAKFLETNYPIKVRKVTYVYKGKLCKKYEAKIRFMSKQIAYELEKYGIVPAKSLIAKAKNGIENSRHFWRGMIDGDGTVALNFKWGRDIKYPYIKLCGSEFIIKQFNDFLKKEINVIPNKIVPDGSIYTVSYSGKKAIKIVKFLYNNCTIALDRKLETAKEIMNYKFIGFSRRIAKAKAKKEIANEARQTVIHLL